MNPNSAEVGGVRTIFGASQTTFGRRWSTTWAVSTHFGHVFSNSGRQPFPASLVNPIETPDLFGQFRSTVVTVSALASPTTVQTRVAGPLLRVSARTNDRRRRPEPGTCPRIPAGNLPPASANRFEPLRDQSPRQMQGTMAGRTAAAAAAAITAAAAATAAATVAKWPALPTNSPPPLGLASGGRAIGERPALVHVSGPEEGALHRNAILWRRREIRARPAWNSGDFL